MLRKGCFRLCTAAIQHSQRVRVPLVGRRRLVYVKLLLVQLPLQEVQTVLPHPLKKTTDAKTRNALCIL